MSENESLVKSIKGESLASCISDADEAYISTLLRDAGINQNVVIEARRECKGNIPADRRVVIADGEEPAVTLHFLFRTVHGRELVCAITTTGKHKGSGGLLHRAFLKHSGTALDTPVNFPKATPQKSTSGKKDGKNKKPAGGKLSPYELAQSKLNDWFGAQLFTAKEFQAKCGVDQKTSQPVLGMLSRYEHVHFVKKNEQGERLFAVGKPSGKKGATPAKPKKSKDGKAKEVKGTEPGPQSQETKSNDKIQQALALVCDPSGPVSKRIAEIERTQKILDEVGNKITAMGIRLRGELEEIIKMIS